MIEELKEEGFVPLLKPNIEGKITNNNLNYTPEDAERLAVLFPENIEAERPKVKQNRVRYESDEDIPDMLPTAGLYPYPMDEHDLIGEYESKKNIYLMLAHAYNKLVKRVEKLEQGKIDTDTLTN